MKFAVFSGVARVLRLALLVSLVFVGPAIAQQPDTLSESYSDWVVRCQTTEASERRCYLSQTLRRQGDGGTVLALEFIIGADDTPRMTMLAPFGVLVTGNIKLMIDGVAAEDLNFRTCLPAGCIVETVPSDELLAALRRGNQLSVGLPIAQTEDLLQLQVSLKGFTAAFNRLRDLAGT